ncbi:hypothetical protein PIB30_074794 [Stylosanthes scabra]|uniref:Uncharacterized protein n=1 Tax=Stylosanthes scabra TaxID=79078 RepID=A0ABU6QPI7_9FABA|nr:hypothetical protein [Stylosanthes scabra]
MQGPIMADRRQKSFPLVAALLSGDGGSTARRLDVDLSLVHARVRQQQQQIDGGPSSTATSEPWRRSGSSGSATRWWWGIFCLHSFLFPSTSLFSISQHGIDTQGTSSHQITSKGESGVIQGRIHARTAFRPRLGVGFHHSPLTTPRCGREVQSTPGSSCNLIQA